MSFRDTGLIAAGVVGQEKSQGHNQWNVCWIHENPIE